MKIIGLVGNNNNISYNRTLLQFMASHFTDNVNIEICEIDAVPLFSEKMANEGTPEAVKRLSNAIEAADGVVIATPEYDHSIPACLKSVIEWLSYVSHPFNGKPVMIVGVSLGVQGTSFAQTQLREILNSPGINAQVLSGNQFMLGHAKQMFDSGKLTDEKTIVFLEKCFESFTKFIQMNNLIEV